MYDAIVIGVGGMGSAAVYHLARRGASVLGLEQFDIPHEFGSSHGVSRIIRLGYAEGSFYVPLLYRSYDLWFELENLTGERLLIITGGIDAGTENSEAVSGVVRSCEEYRLPYDVLDHREVNERFPGYNLTEGMVGVFQWNSGFLLPERCIVAHVQAAQKLGAEVHGRERVSSWKVDDGTVLVTTQKGEEEQTHRARKLVITAGPWAASLLPELAPRAVPERQVLIWTQPLRHPEHFALGAFPIFNLTAPEGRFYGFPVHSVPGFKIGKYHHREERIDPDKMNRGFDPEDEKVLREGIRKYFPDAGGPTMAMKTCIFTNTRDEDFILDLHPTQPQVAVAAGFSGHGFKFCSVVGEIMAQLALDGKTTHNIDPFAWDRPRLRGQAG
jgi:sarcosine oxidase